MFQGIKFDFYDRQISHFQYDDDTILFIKNEDHSIKGLKKVLLLFQVIAGLSINFNKSVIYYVSNDRDYIVKGTTILRCQSGLLPFKYLGVWVGLEKNLLGMEIPDILYSKKIARLQMQLFKYGR